MHDAPRACPTPDPEQAQQPDESPTCTQTATIVRMPMESPDSIMIFTREDGTCVLVADTDSDPEHLERVRQAAFVLATLPHPRRPSG